jgi:hypothetical protein
MKPTPNKRVLHGNGALRIIGEKGDWHVEHNGKVADTYATKEAAFEAAVAAASLAIVRATKSRSQLPAPMRWAPPTDVTWVRAVVVNPG